MIQMNLFEQTLALSSRTDPETSRQAEKEIKSSGLLSIQLRETLEALLRYPKNLTSRELASRTRLDYHEVARRLPDLATLGLAKQGPKRRCRVGGKLCVTWRPV